MTQFKEVPASNPKLQSALLRHAELLINKLIIIKREVKYKKLILIFAQSGMSTSL